MAKMKHIYQTMLEDSFGYRSGRYGKVTYESKPKGKRDKDKRKVKRK